MLIFFFFSYVFGSVPQICWDCPSDLARWHKEKRAGPWSDWEQSSGPGKMHSPGCLVKIYSRFYQAQWTDGNFSSMANQSSFEICNSIPIDAIKYIDVTLKGAFGRLFHFCCNSALLAGHTAHTALWHISAVKCHGLTTAGRTCSQPAVNNVEKSSWGSVPSVLLPGGLIRKYWNLQSVVSDWTNWIHWQPDLHSALTVV